MRSHGEENVAAGNRNATIRASPLVTADGTPPAGGDFANAVIALLVRITEGPMKMLYACRT